MRISVNKLATSNSLILNPLIFRFKKKSHKVARMENEKNPLRKLNRIASNVKQRVINKCNRCVNYIERRVNVVGTFHRKVVKIVMKLCFSSNDVNIVSRNLFSIYGNVVHRLTDVIAFSRQ